MNKAKVIQVLIAGFLYLTAIGSHILRGHDFRASESDSAAIVNEQMARRYWGDPGAALGRLFQFDGRQRQVVGIVPPAVIEELLTKIAAAMPPAADSPSDKPSTNPPAAPGL